MSSSGASFAKDQFSGSDKKKVIDLLMSNENVLLFLYEKLFP